MSSGRVPGRRLLKIPEYDEATQPPRRGTLSAVGEQVLALPRTRPYLVDPMAPQPGQLRDHTSPDVDAWGPPRRTAECTGLDARDAVAHVSRHLVAPGTDVRPNPGLDVASPRIAQRLDGGRHDPGCDSWPTDVGDRDSPGVDVGEDQWDTVPDPDTQGQVRCRGDQAVAARRIGRHSGDDLDVASVHLTHHGEI